MSVSPGRKCSTFGIASIGSFSAYLVRIEEYECDIDYARLVPLFCNVSYIIRVNIEQINHNITHSLVTHWWFGREMVIWRRSGVIRESFQYFREWSREMERIGSADFFSISLSLKVEAWLIFFILLSPRVDANVSKHRYSHTLPSLQCI